MHKTSNPRKLAVGLFGTLLFVAASSHAQTAQRSVKVEEAEEGRIHWLLPKISQEVIKAFSTRIAATTRYTLEGSPAELVVVIICLESRKDSLAGGFCTYKFEYHSKKIPEFNMPLGAPRLVTRSEASEIGEYIFQDFVNETSEAKLSVAELEAAFRVANFCSKPANQLPCSGKFQ
jgi:hypothetical protein